MIYKNLKVLSMMLWNCELGNIIGLYETRYIVYLFSVITALLSELRYVGSLRILTRSVPHQQLRWPPYVTIQPSRLQFQKCRLLHRCEDMDPSDFNTYDVYDKQKSDNLRKAVNHVSQDAFGDRFKLNFKTFIQSTENIAHSSTSITPYSQRSYVEFDYGIHDGIDNNQFLATTPIYGMVPPPSTILKLKQIVANKKSQIISHKINKKQGFFESKELSTPLEYTVDLIGTNKVTKKLPLDKKSDDEINKAHRKKLLLYEFKRGLDKLERKFYTVTFTKLANMTAGGIRAENAISFVQSGLFLQLNLLALSIERAPDVKTKIDTCIGLQTNLSNAERIQLIDDVVSMLPNATHGLIFRWSSHLVLGPRHHVSEEFKSGPAAALRLRVDQVNGTESPEELTAFLNRMVEEDSKGAIHNTFEPEDLSGTISAIFFTTLYLRSRWRTAPTVLNGSRSFRDFYEDPDRTVRMIRINDMMRYANLTDCDAEALEVFYGKPGLSLLILVPQGSSLRRLAAYVAEVGLTSISARMRTLRVAADLPLYTLRMSLLLPSKLEGLGLPELLNVDNSTDSELKMSHGLQRLMFWAEAGRTAFKDDGLEWDDPPDMKIVVDRPYLFFVRWQNMTLMNGNFVL